MLVLSRKPGERIVFDVNGVIFEVIYLEDGRRSNRPVRFGIEAPPAVKAMRKELMPGFEKKKPAN